MLVYNYIDWDIFWAHLHNNKNLRRKYWIFIMLYVFGNIGYKLHKNFRSP